WWPVHEGPRRAGFDPVFEVMVGAILTQNTAWSNVEKAVDALHREGLLDPASIKAVHCAKLKSLIRPAGYFNQKAKGLKVLAEFVDAQYRGHADLAAKQASRDDLLDLWGVGPETADSILLYAGNRPEFVIDTYTKRLCASHGVELSSYDDYKMYFHDRLEPDTKLFNEFHALIVKWGKER
ncbi:MAG: hypothetical protein ABIA47_00770, partial [bacterium]